MTKREMYIKMILTSILRRRSRVMIAVLAIAIGATILSGLVTIYYDIPRQLGKEFRSYGANLALITDDDVQITDADIQTVRGIIGEAAIVGMAPYRYHTTKIHEQPYVLAGTDMEQARLNSPFWYVSGRWIGNHEANGVMIGREIAETLNLNVGDTFVIEGVKYGAKGSVSSQTASAEENKKRDSGDPYFSEKLTVEGIITTGGAEEGFVFLSTTDLGRIIENEPLFYDMVECSIEADADALNALAQKISNAIPYIMARPIRRVTQSQDIVLGKLQALVYIVTIVVLIITMISVSTTMMAMVAERRKEIGLKKALGAENRLIIKDFIGEGIALGIIGGALGVFLGFEFAQTVSLSVFGRAISFQWTLIPVTLLVSVLITVVASIWPIRNILDIHPAIVLKGE